MANQVLFDVACFGALNMDAIYKVDKIPKIDEESYVLDVKLSGGGSAANTAVGIANFGKKVAFVGAVGDDDYGKMLLEEFLKLNVTPILKVGERSGRAMIFVDSSGQRAILVDPGANDEVSEFPKIKCRILHLTSFVCKKTDRPFYAQIEAAEKFEEVSLDPGNIYAKREDVTKLVSKCSIFMPNSMEIEEIFKTDYKKAAEKALEFPKVKIVVVKLGDKGCYAISENCEVKVPAVKAKVVDTTGAGDAFNSGFLYAMLEGYDLEMCCHAGNFSAAKCIEKYGARNYPEKLELEEFLSSI